MNRPLKIAPSLLAADFANLGAAVRDVTEAGADWIHLDVMDGHFVPNITFGPEAITALRAHTRATFDCHLMIAPCDPHLEAFVRAGCDRITVHAEAGPYPHRSLQTIRAMGKRAGVALKPATPVSAVEHVLDAVDLILLMSVEPGFGGQAFLPSVLEKARQASAMIGGRPIDLAIDGGVVPATAGLAAGAGVNVLVAGSAVFKGSGAPVLKAGIDAIRASAEAARRQRESGDRP